jgi:hypothetical protein
MNINQLKRELEDFLAQEHLSASIYFLKKDDQLRLADIDDDVMPELKNLYVENLEKVVIDKEDVSTMPLSEADERKNVIFEYDFDEDILPMSSMTNISNPDGISRFRFSDDELNEIDAIICKIANSQKGMYFFSRFYNMNLIKRGNVISFIKSATRFEKFDSEVLRISGKFDIFRLNNKDYILNYDTIESHYGFGKLISTKASEYAAQIHSLNLISNMEKFNSLIETKHSIARKLVKVARSSPVLLLDIPNDKIVEFAKSHSLLKKEFKYSNDDKIIINSQKHCNLFLKLLDDDFLRSNLTDLDYDARAKDEVKIEGGN